MPLTHDGRDAPLGCSALRELSGRSLVSRAVGALASSGKVGLVLVPVPPAVVDALTGLLRPGAPGLPDDVAIDVVPVPENGPAARLRAVLSAPTGSGVIPEAEVVVVLDPQYPLGSAGLTQDTVDRLHAGPELAGVIPVRPVTDTLKWVDEDDVVTGTADRDGFLTVHSPQAYRVPALASALATADARTLRAPGPEVLARLVAQNGGRLATVPAPGEVLRIVTTDDLVLAEAMLLLGGGLDAGAGQGRR